MADSFGRSAAGAEQPCPLKKDHWLEIQLLDEEDMPVANEEYVVTLPDGSRVRGYLDADGGARLALDDPGNCKVTFPRIDGVAWKDL